MRISRGNRLVTFSLALSSLALTIGMARPIQAQQPANSDVSHADQGTSLATVEQLKSEAFKAIQGGNLDKSNELIKTAESISGDKSFARVSEWLAQYRTQR